jgi:flagellar motor switch protein FliG
MFTFDDLGTLDAGGMQTLLAAADRATLVIALKGAKDTTSAAFFANVTQRAGDLLREEIAALGPVRRSEVEAARAELVELARQLIGRGDIHARKDTDPDELVE